MFYRVSILIILIAGSIYTQEQRLLNLLQNPEQILKITENDVSNTLNQLGQEISKMTENALKTQLANDIGISESLLSAENRTDELKKAVLENLIDELNKILLNHSPNASINHQEYSNLGIHEKVNLLVDHAVQAIHDYLWNLLTNIHDHNNNQDDNIDNLDTKDRDQLEKMLAKLIEKLHAELNQLFKNGDKLDCKNLSIFKKSVQHLKWRMKKLIKEYQHTESEGDEQKLLIIKKEYGKTFFNLIVEIEKFLAANKNETETNPILASFNQKYEELRKKINFVVSKIEDLDELEGIDYSKIPDYEDEKKKFLITLQNLIENVNKFFEENDYKEFPEHKAKLEEINLELVSVYKKIDEIKNSDDRHNWKKLKALKAKFAKLVREYLATIESFLNVNSHNQKLMSYKADFDKVKNELEQALNKNDHKHDDKEDSGEDSSEEEVEKPEIQPNLSKNLFGAFRQASRIFDTSASNVFNKMKKDLF